RCGGSAQCDGPALGSAGDSAYMQVETGGQRSDAMDAHAFSVTRTEAEWRSRLTPEQYRVMRDHGTEPPGSCALLHETREGSFFCAGCDTPLFASTLKFESGTGWPSFNDPIPG